MATVMVGTNGVAATVLAPVARPRLRLVLAALSGLTLAAAFPKLDLEPLAWIGLVPLLVAIEGVRPRTAFRFGWFSGLVFYLATVYWVVHTISAYSSVPQSLALAILLLQAAVLGCYTGAFAAGMRWLEERDLPALWLAPGLWVVLEWLRSWFFIGFPWAALGYSQYRHHDLVQMAEVTGVYGVSALLVLFNVVAAAVLRARGAALRALWPALAVLSVLVAGIPLAGGRRASALAARTPAGHVRVALVQGNIEQDQKWDPAYQDETLGRYRDLTLASLAEHPDLIVWPETATPFFFQDPGPLREDMLALATRAGVPLLFGSPAYRYDEKGEPEEFNRAYVVSAQGRELGTYDKIELVPFGEYVPYERALFFVHRMVEAVGRMVPGLTPTVLRLPQGRFGVLICYEGVFPALTHRFVENGADFLVNITNDAWFGPTSAPYQHLAQVTFRAIENRVPVVRAANTGISAIIDPDGRIRWQGPLYEPLWHVGEISWPGVRTFYTRYGDVFVYACVLATAIAFGYGVRRHGAGQGKR
jgi:apolipoprotein N-acyltransferase